MADFSENSDVMAELECESDDGPPTTPPMGQKRSREEESDEKFDVVVSKKQKLDHDALCDEELREQKSSLNAGIKLWYKRKKNCVSVGDAILPTLVIRTSDSFGTTHTTCYVQGDPVLFPKSRFKLGGVPTLADRLSASNHVEDKHKLTCDGRVLATPTMQRFFRTICVAYVNRVCGGRMLVDDEIERMVNEKKGFVNRESGWYTPNVPFDDQLVAVIEGATIEDRVRFFLENIVSGCAAGELLRRAYDTIDIRSIPFRLSPFTKHFDSKAHSFFGVNQLFGVMKDNEVGLSKDVFIMDKVITSKFGQSRKGPMLCSSTTFVMPTMKVKFTYHDGVSRCRVECVRMILLDAPELKYEADDDLFAQM